MKGPIVLGMKGEMGERELSIEAPSSAEGEIALDARESVGLKRLRGTGALKRIRYRLPAGQRTSLKLKYT